MADYDDRYSELLNRIKPIIISELKERYRKYCSDFSLSIWSRIDFGSHIILPTFVIWAIWMAFRASTSHPLVTIAVSAGFFILSCWFYHFWCSIPDGICDYFFEKYEYKNVILLCVKWSKDRALRDADTKEKIEDIEKFYEYVQRNIVDKWFDYH